MREKFNFCNKLDREEILEIFCRSTDMTKEIDTRIETAQIHFNSIGNVIKDCLDIFLNYVESDSVFLLARDEELNFRIWESSKNESYLDEKSKDNILKLYYKNPFEKEYIELNEFYIRKLDIEDKLIGLVGYKISNVTEKLKYSNEYMIHVFSEFIDIYIEGENNSKKKHIVKMLVGNALENRILSDGLVTAINILKGNIDFNSLILIFHEEHYTSNSMIQYFVYSDKFGFLDPYHFFNKEFHQFISDNSTDILNGNTKKLLERFSITNYKEEFLISGIKDAEKIGKLIISSQTSDFDTFEKELIEIFISFIQQRVVDFNKEWRMLSQFFSVTHRINLLAKVNYQNEYLTPKLENVAIMYADISSFTFFSEQILKSPKTITDMFDIWAKGVLKIIWSNGGVCDKFVGDCAIAIFGPPFYDKTEHDCCLNAMKCAIDVRKFTSSLLEMDEECFRLIRDSGSKERFGVSTGLNFGLLNIGVIGPKNDFTGFGSVMNNTARIQGKANNNEILMMENFYELIKDKIEVIGPYSTDLKNVKNLAKYFKFSSLI